MDASMLLSSDHEPQPEDAMDNTDTAAAETARAIEAAFGGHWGVWLSETGRWWGARSEPLTGEEVNAGCVPFVQAETPSELTARLHEQDGLRAPSAQGAVQVHRAPSARPAVSDDMTLDDLRRIYAIRWEIAPITGGYRAVPRETAGHTPIPRYGRTLAELAESIRSVEAQP
jgi:hypothetical protein